jgi:hypothetical protein
LSQRDDGDATGHRGPRAAAGDGNKKECLTLCSGPTAAVVPLLHFLSLFPGRWSRFRSMGVGARGAVPYGEAAVTMAPGREQVDPEPG